MFQLRLLFILSLSCNSPAEKDAEEGKDTSTFYDADNDGYDAAFDCDDTNPLISPSAPEICDGLDNNCDGDIDEDVLVIYHLDADGDGYGDPELVIEGCEAPSGYVVNGEDCDDNVPITHPNALEQCDAEDNDCDGEIDEELLEIWYADIDSDGYGDPDNEIVSCNPGVGFVGDNTDCDDENEDSYPEAPEICDDLDNDCDSVVDNDLVSNWYVDQDNDGFGSDAITIETCSPPQGYVDNAADCDDVDSSINPLADEWCDFYDNDCNGLIDEAASIDALVWYADADSDGYGDVNSTVNACLQPSGYLSDATDCNDADPLSYPGAYEYCNGYDDNCDGTTDEASALDTITWYVDTDVDGFGDPSVTTLACNQPSGYVSDDTDCDDANGLTNPAADEYCNGYDDNCNGATDEESAVDAPSWFYDSDLDGFGDATIELVTCYQPSGYVADATDCDDNRDLTNPDADEYCNGFDDNCDGDTDEDSALDAPQWHSDSDADGFGNPNIIQVTCYQPNAHVLDGSDCDDARALTNPNASEYCNGIDDDCNNYTDDPYALDALLWFEDGDADTYGNPAISTPACGQPVGFVSDNTDCDDARDLTYPGAQEYCNSIDDDCDIQIDEQGALGFNTFYLDADSDGYGNPLQTASSCVAPSGYVADGSDCDDGNSAIHPNAPEYCNGVDDDCDNATDENTSVDALTWFQDADSDGFGNSNVMVASCSQPTGYASVGNDCNDGSNSVNPSASEYCNAIDDDCDGSIDENAVDAGAWFVDSDADGYGSQSVTYSCSQPGGHVTNSSDCNDGNASVNPAAVEVCDGIDQNCNGSVDEGVAMFLWYLDSDGDGYGSNSSVQSCSQPGGYVSNSGDCNDGNATVNPAATEVCDGSDQNCNGSVDEGLTTSTWYLDSDGDGYGSNSSLQSCSQPGGYVGVSGDCNDGSAAINPGVSEICDGTDQNCNGSVDEGLPTSTWYLDGDGDGYGSNSSVQSCSQPGGYVGIPGDCNDGNASINPVAVEVCDGTDQNCNGTIDEGAQGATYYLDSDGDGYGSNSSVQSCTQPTGYATTSGDCNDGNAGVNPGQTGYFSSSAQGSYDYNCNGVEEPQITSTWVAQNFSCPCSPGWLGSIPACGTTNFYVTSCVYEVTFGCLPNIVESTQSCR